MTVIVEKPYRFVPPHRGKLWPSFVQSLRLVDRYLAKQDGVVDYECRHLDRLGDSLAAGDAVLLTPNHCRYADPLVLGWPARELKTHLFAMASWHLFAHSRLQAFAIQKMGGFSIYREGTDRQSLETAIGILTAAERPLILFPEGTTNCTNDVLQPLLEGVAFIARTAAKRRAKQYRRVVIHPVAIKYLFLGDIQQWGDRAASKLEARLGWRPTSELPLLDRIERLAAAMISIHEVRYFGTTTDQPLARRRDALVHHLLGTAEAEYGVPADQNVGPLARVRRLRATLAAELMRNSQPSERQRLYHTIDAVELSQQLYSYPDRYLFQFPTTDTQILETLERLQDGLMGSSDHPGPLKAVIEFGEAIEVPPDRAPRGGADPLMIAIQQPLAEMLQRLSLEANLVESGPGSAERLAPETPEPSAATPI